MILNLDSTFNPRTDLATINFEAFTFSGGEPHIKILETEISDHVVISHRIQSFNDMGLFILAVDALKHLGCRSIEAIVPYFPAARQDRLMMNGEPLSVKVYAELFNQLALTKITIFDAHSEVAPAVLNNCIDVNNHGFIQQVIADINEPVTLISPDGGALKKIYKLAAKLQDYPVIECSKSRDVKTGKLSGFKVYADDLEGKSCLIVDDICDGGGTFLGLAKELKAKNAGKLYLAVSHGIFNKGFEAFDEYFEKLYCTDAFKTIKDTKKLKQIQLQNILNNEQT